MKKKFLKNVLLVAVSVVLTAALVIGGTLAYLTDRDQKVNVFTVGNVDIELNETFEQGAELLPGKDIEKVVSITNTGKNDAYVWVTIAIPSALDNDDASQNVIHFNYAKESVEAGKWTWKTEGGAWNISDNHTISNDTKSYNIYNVLYQTVLKPGETTPDVMNNVYLDVHVDITPEGDLYWVDNGTATDLKWNVNVQGNPMFYVAAYAIQADNVDINKDGKTSVYEAYAAYNGQWRDNGGVNYDVPTLVSNADELSAALENGGTVALIDDIEVDVNGTFATVAAGANVTLDLNGHDIIATTNVNSGASQAVIGVKGTLNVIGNGMISLANDDAVWGDGYCYATITVTDKGNVTLGEGVAVICDAGAKANTGRNTKSAMAYAVDVHGSGVVTVDGATVASNYIAIRTFIVNTDATINVNSGIIDGYKGWGIWDQDKGDAKINIADGVDYSVEGDFRIYTFTDVEVVSNVGELATALENDENVVLATDIVYSNTDPNKQMILKSSSDINFDGNGKTITTEGADPSVGNHGYVGFVPTGDDKNATVSNLTVTGTGFVELGDYYVQGGTYIANNLVIENLVSTLSNENGSDSVGCAFMQYGTGTLNNCVMTGTTALINGTKPYDAGFGNTTTTTINGGEYGVIRVWEQAHVTINGAEIGTIDSRAITTRNLGMLTIGAGTHVGTINLIPGDKYTPALTIEEGATVDAIVYNGVTYTQAEWLAR